MKMTAGQCAVCGASVSYLDNSCPQCGARLVSNTIRNSAGLLVCIVLVFGLIFGVVYVLSSRVLLWSQQFHPEQGAAGSVPPVAAPFTQQSQDAGWVAKAMVDCESQAAQDSQGLHVLIIPVTATAQTQQQWVSTSIDSFGDSAVLLQSNETLNGLRRGQLALYHGSFIFSIRDLTTNAVHSWRPAIGVSQFLLPNAGAMTSFRPGFHLPTVQGDPQWGSVIERSRGICYWGSILVRN